VTPVPPRRDSAPVTAPLAGMRICRRPAQCPFVRPERSLADDLSRWHRALSAALPGDDRLVHLLLGDVAELALPLA
jgi:hypothetical protein